MKCGGKVLSQNISLHVRDSVITENEKKKKLKTIRKKNLNETLPVSRRFYALANSRTATIFQMISNITNDNVVPDLLNCIRYLNCYCCDCVWLCAFPMTKSNYLRRSAMTVVDVDILLTVVQVRFLH